MPFASLLSNNFQGRKGEITDEMIGRLQAYIAKDENREGSKKTAKVAQNGDAAGENDKAFNKLIEESTDAELIETDIKELKNRNEEEAKQSSMEDNWKANHHQCSPVNRQKRKRVENIENRKA